MSRFYIILTGFLVSCGVIKWEYPSGDVAGGLNNMNALIQDCPEEMIINNMPMVGPGKRVDNRYYIYKGQRKEIKDFDSAWVSSHCNVKTTTVY
jgi:hypothetical protein